MAHRFARAQEFRRRQVAVQASVMLASVAVVEEAARLEQEEEDEVRLEERLEEEEREAAKRQRSCWVKVWRERRPELGQFEQLMQLLEREDTKGFKSFQRMCPELWHELLDMVGPRITKQRTYMREPLPPGLRLALTLRFLATGEYKFVCKLMNVFFILYVLHKIYFLQNYWDKYLAQYFNIFFFLYVSGDTYKSQNFNFMVGDNTAGGIVPEVCDALYEVLSDREYFSVCLYAEINCFNLTCHLTLFLVFSNVLIEKYKFVSLFSKTLTLITVIQTGLYQFCTYCFKIAVMTLFIVDYLVFDFVLFI